MTELITSITTAIATFTVTNIDDILILILLFTQINALFRRRQIVFGQYLGFITLVVASLPGFFGSFLLPDYFLKYLGLVPLFLGLIYLNNLTESETESLTEVLPDNNSPGWLKRLLSPEVCSVASITIANGSDNISIYLPLFASSSIYSLTIIITTFLFLVGVWCFVAYRLTNLPRIASLLKERGDTFVPSVLIALGVYILRESFLATLLAFIISYLWVINLVKIHSSQHKE